MQLDTKIEALVATFNHGGMKTYASCQGHGLRLDVIRPYIAFRCDAERAIKLERLLREDAESNNPKLSWGWCLTGYFDSDFALSYRLSTENPHRFYHRYWRPALDRDLATIAEMFSSLFHYRFQNDNTKMIQTPSSYSCNKGGEGQWNENVR